ARQRKRRAASALSVASRHGTASIECPLDVPSYPDRTVHAFLGAPRRWRALLRCVSGTAAFATGCAGTIAPAPTPEPAIVQVEATQETPVDEPGEAPGRVPERQPRDADGCVEAARRA